MKLLFAVAVMIPVLMGLLVTVAAGISSEKQIQLAAEIEEVAAATERDQAAADGVSGRCFGDGDGTGAAGILTGEQLTNGATIISVVEGYPLAQRAAVIAVATAVQESSLRNLDHGDVAGPDSRGLFQQRLQFYAHLGDTMDPRQATAMFLDRLVSLDFDDPGTGVVETWETVPLGVAAQAVQISAHPGLYDQHESLAVDLVSQVWSAPCPVVSGGGVVGAYALPIGVEYRAKFPSTHHDYPSVDIGAPTGAQSFAFTSGVAQYVGGACGLGVVIDGDDGHRYINCHFSVRLVPNGARVVAGQLIGEVGNTGNSFGPHLHFDIRVGGAHRCPQSALVALADGVVLSAADIAGLPAGGCTH